MEIPGLEQLLSGLGRIENSATGLMGGSRALGKGLTVGGIAAPVSAGLGALLPGHDASGHERSRLEGALHGAGMGLGAGVGVAGGHALSDAFLRGKSAAYARFSVK